MVWVELQSTHSPNNVTLTKAVQSLSSCDLKGLILFLISRDSFLREGDPVNPGEGWFTEPKEWPSSFLLHRGFSYSLDSPTHTTRQAWARTLKPCQQQPLTVFFFSENLQRGKTAYIPSQEKETSLKHYWTFQISFIVSIVVTDNVGSRKRADSSCSLWVLDLLVQDDFWSTTVTSALQVAAAREKHFFRCWWRMNITSSKDRRSLDSWLHGSKFLNLFCVRKQPLCT